ncbi:MAG: transaminase [Actinomycetota bacterium]
MTSIDRNELAIAMAEEQALFGERHQASLERHRMSGRLLSGVPMPWMTRWPGGWPVYFTEARGAHFVDVDGHEYVDFCMGDTGAMTGHGLEQVADALSARARRGITTMLPSDDALWVAEELERRFGLPKWQFAMTATDANRFVIRFSRELTRRPKIAVFDWCYHGSVDETLVVRDESGRTVSRPGVIGQHLDVSQTSVSIPFNDVEGLETALSKGDVACLLMEPALTNIGIVLPEPGYLEAVRDITRRHGVLLVIDETHTICAGPGGCTRAWGLEPDFFVIGKPIGGGMPVAAYGMSGEVAARLEDIMSGPTVDVSGVGGTLAGNALALAAVRATLQSTLRDEDFARMIPLAEKWTEGVRNSYESKQLPWSVQQLGARAEYWFCPPPRDGAAAAAASDAHLESFMHLYALNRGVLLTPFHNMALFSPFHVPEDVEQHTAVFASAVDRLCR